MSHVTSETALRLKEACFPQKIGDAQFWFVASGNGKFDPTVIVVAGGMQQHILENAYEEKVFAPTATDILQHLPGWNLAFTTVSKWICFWEDIDGNVTEFIGHDNPAEAAAEAWFFEQSHAKK